MDKQKYTKTYFKGSAKEVFEGLVNISVNEEEFLKGVVRKTHEKGNYLQFSIAKRRDGADKFGNTHSVFSSAPEGSSQPKQESTKATKDEWDFGS